jgi:signal transduction histidine kinase
VRRRLVLSYLSLTLFVLLALGLPLGLTFANAERRRLVSDVQHDAFALALRADEYVHNTVATPAAPFTISALTRIVRHYESNVGGRVVVVDVSGGVVADSSTPAGRQLSAAATAEIGREPELVGALRGHEATAEHPSVKGGNLLAVAVPIVSDGHTDGAVLITYPLSTLDSRIEQNWLLLLALSGVISLVVLLVSVLLARSFTKPLAELDEAAARLGEGDLRVRVPVPDDPPELSGLARSFNATAGRLEALLRSQQAFVADASHQLRTPLAALRLRLENLEAEGAYGEADDLERALTEVRRLSQLVDSLLLLARAEQSAPALVDLDLASVVEGRADAWFALAAERDVAIDTDVVSVAVLGTPGRLEQVLDNLLNNALEVAPSGTAVRVSARRAGDRVELDVCDAGPGMSEEQRARAFDRFWRATPGRRDRGGFGLGLAIVRQLVTADGGSVELDVAPEGGLAVRLTLHAGDLRRARRVQPSSPPPGAAAVLVDAGSPVK